MEQSPSEPFTIRHPVYVTASAGLLALPTSASLPARLRRAVAYYRQKCLSRHKDGIGITAAGPPRNCTVFRDAETK